MLRNMQLFMSAVRLSWYRESEFAADLFVSLVHYAVQLGATIVFWLSLMTGFQSLGTWTLPDLILLSCFFELTPLVDVFFLGFRRLPERVRTGELDKYLYRPCNPILGLLSESLYIRYPIYQAVTASALFVWAVCAFDLHFNATAILQALLVFILGVYITRFISGIVTLATFWVGKVDSLQMILGLFSQLARYPTTLYGPLVKNVLNHVVPYGLIATLPVSILRGWAPDPWFWLVTLTLLIAWGSLFDRVWRAALRHYEAFGG